MPMSSLRIAEHVLRIGQCRGRIDRNVTRKWPQVAAFSRPQHQAMLPEAHLSPLSIDCLVLDLECGHKQDFSRIGARARGPKHRAVDISICEMMDVARRIGQNDK